jgi:hypothetical protein
MTGWVVKVVAMWSGQPSDTRAGRIVLVFIIVATRILLRTELRSSLRVWAIVDHTSRQSIRTSQKEIVRRIFCRILLSAASIG